LTGQTDETPERLARSEGGDLPLAGADALFGLPAIWLRDNCGCELCRDPGSGERLTSVADLAAQVSITSVRETGDRIELEFGPDGHRSVYDTGWLNQFRPGPDDAQDAEGAPGAQGGPGAAWPHGLFAAAEDGRTEDAKQLWDAAQIGDAFPMGSWPLYQADAVHRQACLRAVLRDGFVVLANMPREPDAVLAVAQSTGVVRETEFGRVIDVRLGRSASSQAFSARPLAPCTAAPFRDPLLTVKILGCVSSAPAGGESTLVDGFFAAARLRDEQPAAFAALSSTAVTFTHADASVDLRATRPVITVDPRGRIRAVCYAANYLAPLRGAPREIATFYAAYRSFTQLLVSPELRLTFRLRPGDCLILDNTRILNGRTGFADESERYLQACWSDLDGLASNLAVLERRQHNGGGRR
jgi:gamma-butyrobetaine dioxygenase